ncbi:MAG: L,D-transpeptidase family protein [Bacteroidota bacterium]|nr:L,D-transpeptidase family protein [Bacteroidota bacterium]
MKNNIFGFFAVILYAGLMTSCDIFKSPADDFDLESKKILEIINASSDTITTPDYFPDKDVRKTLVKEFGEFYKLRDYKLAWVNFDEPSPQVEDLLEAIDIAHIEGLEPDNYKVAEVENLLQEVYKIESRKERRKRLKARKSKNEEIANEAKQQDTVKLYNLVRLDFLLTSSYLTYASHLLSGKINPDEKEAWFPAKREKDFAPYLNEALSKNNVKSSLMELVPKHKQYKKLKEALAQYQKISEKEDWSSIAPKKEVKTGSSDVVIPLLRRRLASTGDLEERKINGKDSAIFNTDLVEALKGFQARHGLEENGKLDQATLKAVNIPISERLAQLKLNLERMRWLPDSFGNKYILVNIPEYMLRIYNGDNVDMEMKVIVGKIVNATPIFSDLMEYIVFSPTWTVPKSIGVEEMLPKLKEDPEYLTKKNFKLYDSWEKDAEPINPQDIKWEDVEEENFNFRIVENPGKGNALGSVKFMFPNDLDIYLHDTPAGHLFDRKERSFSHGCIRVEKPSELAEYLLHDNKEWDKEKIKEAMAQEEPENVKLTEKVSVHLVYWTAWVNDNDKINFRDDIYMLDRNQLKQIENKEKQMVISKNQNN